MKNLVLAFVLTAAVAALLAIFVFRSRDFAVIAALTGLAGLLVWDLEVWSWFSTKATVAEVEETGFSPMTASVLAVELSGLDLTDHGRKVTGQLIMPVAFVAPAPQAIAPAAIEVATVVEVAAPKRPVPAQIGGFICHICGFPVQHWVCTGCGKVFLT